jgi:hypothetical protein
VTGSPARVPLPKSTTGVEPEAFDQLRPFQSHVTAFGARLVPHAEELAGVPCVELADELGAGAMSGMGAPGAAPLFVEAAPEDAEPEDAEPEPDEHAIGPWFDPAASWAPINMTSRLTGSYAICGLSNAGGDVAGFACVQLEPFHVQVSSRPRVLVWPPKRTID